MNAAALSIVSDEPSATPRTMLAAHLDRVAKAASEYERVSRPAQRLRDQLRIAEERLAAAEADLAAINEAHAVALRDQAKSGAAIELGKPPTSAKAEQAIDDARRLCANLRAALAECDTDANGSSAALRALQAQTDALKIEVMAEQASILLERYTRAYVESVTAKTNFHTIVHAMASHGRQLESVTSGQGIPWLQRVMALQAAFDKVPDKVASQKEIEQRHAQWSAMLARLSIDAMAKVED